MFIPHSLRTAIEQKLSGISLKQLAAAAAELTKSYRRTALAGSRHISNEIHRAAYLAVRLPANLCSENWKKTRKKNWGESWE
jgi:ribosomal protein RSM22 (predicted rRNA methylase)